MPMPKKASATKRIQLCTADGRTVQPTREIKVSKQGQNDLSTQDLTQHVRATD